MKICTCHIVSAKQCFICTFTFLLKFLPNSCQPKNKKPVVESKCLSVAKELQLGPIDTGRDPNSILIAGDGPWVFMEKKKED